MKKIFLFATLLLALFAETAVVFAQDDGTIIESAQRYEIVEIINKGLAYAIMIAAFLSVVFIFIGGISFILSGGDEGKIKQAVSTIRYAIIGLIVTVLSVVIVGTVGKALGLDIIKYIDFASVIQTVSNAGGSSSGSGSGSLD